MWVANEEHGGDYRNTIAGSPPGGRIFLLKKGSPLKNRISQFLFFSKKHQ
jgi:hypothetical protein